MPEEFPLKEESELSAAELGSYWRGLKLRYDRNKQTIALWREYGHIARTLRRDYRGRENEVLSGMVANWITASSLAQTALDLLMVEQVSIDREIARVSGQRELGGEEGRRNE